jgi:hypothetical protein
VATTYFGFCNSSTGAGTGVAHCGYAWGSQWTTAGYVCPGTGDQTLVTLGIEADGADTTHIRMAIYNTSRGLVCYATSEKDSAVGWVSWDNTEITWVIGTKLTGGTAYLLVVSADGNPGALGTGSLPADTLRYISNEYTSSAFADPIAAGTGYTTEYNMRCGVEPAAAGGGSVVPQIMMHYARLRK